MSDKPNRVKEERAPFSAIEPDDWVHELIAMTRPGIDFELPSRMPWERQTPFEFDDFS
jgi:hypothetical protein